MANALGSAKIVDVRTWIMEAVAQIQAFVHEELRKQLSKLVIDQMEAELQACISHANQYAALSRVNQAKNRALLEHINNTTASAIPRVRQFDQATPVLAGLMAYRLIARNGLYELDKDPGHITGMRSDMDAYILAMDEISKRVLPKLAVSARLVFDGCRSLPRSEGSKNQAACRYIIDGKTEEPYTNPPRYTNAMIRAEYEKMLQTQYDLFAAQTTSYKSYAENAFNKMCKKVGQSYAVGSAPKTIAKAISLNAVPGQTYKAAGAIIKF